MSETAANAEGPVDILEGLPTTPEQAEAEGLGGSSGDLDRFIPFRRKAIIEMLCEDGRLEGDQDERFRKLSEIISAYYHYQFHHKLEILKDAYFPFNPDLDVKVRRQFSEAERSEHSHCLTGMLREVLNDANYEPITAEDIELALEELSLFSLKLVIDFGDFEEFLLFGRGNVIKTEEIKRWFIFKDSIEVPTYERVVLYIRFKDEAYFEAQGRKVINFEPGSTVIKIFKDMPHRDIEMLFPNTELRMRLFDKLLVGIPGVLGALFILVTKVIKTLPLLFFIAVGLMAGEDISRGDKLEGAIKGAAAIGAFLAYCWRQWDKFKNRRIKYLKTLTDSLYFRNLDNNAGVFHRLIDSAEEEELKEALIAYYFLLVEGPQTAEQLDRRIERWFKEQHQTLLDFEVDGALEKIIAMGIASKQDEVFEVMPIVEAQKHVDSIWDSFFDFDDAKLSCAQLTMNEGKRAQMAQDEAAAEGAKGEPAEGA